MASGAGPLHSFYNEGVSPRTEVPPELARTSQLYRNEHPEIRLHKARTLQRAETERRGQDAAPGLAVTSSDDEPDAPRPPPGATLDPANSPPTDNAAEFNPSLTSLPTAPRTSDAGSRSTHKLRGSASRQRLGHLQDNISQAHVRMNTNPDQAPIDARLPVTTIFRRPKARYLDYDHKIYKIQADGSIVLADFGHGHSIAAGVNDPNHVDNDTQFHLINITRERFDLFIDLLWVGIISEIAEIYYSTAFREDSDVNAAFSQFLLIFLPSWSFWLRMQYFLNNYFMDDFAQRMLTMWLLVLALIWGNNTPTILTEGQSDGQWLISAYIIGVTSMKIFEAVYCIWIPWIRRQFIVETILFVPAGALWITAASMPNLSYRYAFVIAAVTYEYVYSFGLNSPIGIAVVGSTFRKAQDRRHIIIRYGAFFLLALGEGVFLLVRSAPLGPGLSTAAGTGVMALLVYFFIALTYFRGDNSKRMIHAQNRSWWVQNLWVILHVPLFCALVLLSAGVLYLIHYELNGGADVVGYDHAEAARRGLAELLAKRVPSSSDADLTPKVFRVATETVYGCLAVTYATTGMLALLNRSIDAPSELVLSNRWLRMLPRTAGTILFATLWLYDFHHPTTVMGWAVLVAALVYLTEGIAGMERWPRLFERRGSFNVTPDVTDIESDRDDPRREKRTPTMPF